MTQLTYVVPDDLPPLSLGQKVEIVDRLNKVIGTETVTKITKLTITTSCGRRWSLRGYWVSEVIGAKVVDWPFPWIRVPAAAADAAPEDAAATA